MYSQSFFKYVSFGLQVCSTIQLNDIASEAYKKGLIFYWVAENINTRWFETFSCDAVAFEQHCHWEMFHNKRTQGRDFCQF